MIEQDSGATPAFDPEKIQRLFGSPIHIPPEFKSWMIDQMVLNVPSLPVGQAFRGRNLAKVMAHSASAVSGVTATSTSLTTLFSFVLPKGSLTQHGRLVINEHVKVSCADVSNLGHLYLYANGNPIGEFRFATAFLDGAVMNCVVEWVIQNRGAYNSQRVYGFFWLPQTGSFRGVGGGTINTVLQSLDTTQNITIEGKAAWDSGGSQNFAHHFFTSSVYNPAVLT